MVSNLRRERVDVGELLGGVRESYEASAADGGRVSASQRL